jgi:hypothetical protein
MAVMDDAARNPLIADARGAHRSRAAGAAPTGSRA